MKIARSPDVDDFLYLVFSLKTLESDAVISGRVVLGEKKSRSFRPKSAQFDPRPHVSEEEGRGQKKRPERANAFGGEANSG